MEVPLVCSVVRGQSSGGGIIKLLKITLVASTNANEVENIDLRRVLLSKKALFCSRIRTRPNTCFIGPLRVHTSKVKLEYITSQCNANYAIESCTIHLLITCC